MERVETSKSGGRGGREHLPGFTRFLRVLEGLKESSTKAYCEKVEEFLAWLAGNDYPDDVTAVGRRDIEFYLEWCFRRGNCNQTRHTKLTAVSKFFRYLKYEGVSPEDITAEIPKPRIAKKLMQVFTKQDILGMFSQIDIATEKGLRDVCILILAAFCGFRVSEIYNLNLGDVIDDGKDLDFSVVDSKHGGSRVVYLWKAPGVFIRQYYSIRLAHGAKADSPFLISYDRSKPKHRRLTAKAVENLVKKLAARARIRKPAIKTHMLRAMHANDLQYVKGYALTAIMERMGWKDLSTAGRYLVRRERIHRQYHSLHEYWIDFPKCWRKGGMGCGSQPLPENSNHDTDGAPVGQKKG